MEARHPSQRGQRTIHDDLKPNSDLEKSVEGEIFEECVWRGWLHKRSSGIAGHWQKRWCEVRQEKARKARNKAILQYFGQVVSGHSTSIASKRLTLVDAQRETQRDKKGRACLSVAVTERKVRILLSVSSASEADILVSDIRSALQKEVSVSS